jgi:uncharacterized protein
MTGFSKDNGKDQQSFVREPAKRLFSAELKECKYQFKEGDEDKSPTFVLLPTGERANRVFVVGTLTERQRQGEQNIFYRGRVVDPTGTFFIMAGSYQPEAMMQIAKVEPPQFVAVVGKPSVYEKPDGSGALTSIKVESLTVVDKETRDQWIVDTAVQTLQRLTALSTGTTADIAKAKEIYPNLDVAAVRKSAYEALALIKI